MNAFNGARQGERLDLFSAASFSSGETKRGPNPFAAGKKRVTHRPVNRCGFAFLSRQELIQCPIDRLDLCGEKILKFKCARAVQLASRLFGHARLF